MATINFTKTEGGFTYQKDSGMVIGGTNLHTPFSHNNLNNFSFDYKEQTYTISTVTDTIKIDGSTVTGTHLDKVNALISQIFFKSGSGTGGGSDVTLPISATDVTQDSTHRFFTDTERTKLSGIAANATANVGDVTLTGTQTLTNKTLTAPVISTISNTGTLTLPTSSGTLALVSQITGTNSGTNTGDETFTRLNALSGNLNDNKLSGNIPKKDALNTFTQKQAFSNGAYVAGLLESEATSVYNGGNLITYNVGTTVPTFTVTGATGYVAAGGVVSAGIGFISKNPNNGADQIVIGGNNLGYMAGYSSTGVIGWAMYAEYKVITAMSGGSLTANAPDNTVANVALNGTTGNIDMNGFINMKDTVNGNMYKIAMVSGVLTATPV